MACMIIGDSLAVGVGQFRPDCETVAKVGITSQTYLETRFPAQGLATDLVVISLGVNDGETANTQENLETLRARIQARSVVWLLPGLKENVRRMIRQVAGEYGDRLIDTRPEVGRDHLHPSGAGYQRIAAETTGEQGPEVEVALAPTELHMAPIFGQNYPQHRPSVVTRFRMGLTTPRERIRRLRMLRAADESVPVVRQIWSDTEYRHRPSQKNFRVLVADHPSASQHGSHCAPHAQPCQLSVK